MRRFIEEVVLAPAHRCAEQVIRANERIRWLAYAAAILLVARVALADPDAGRAAFQSHECNSCHSVAADGIQVAESEEDDDLDFGDEFGEEDEERKPPDLSGVANRHERDWIEKWLQKKIENDDGYKHKKKFKGKPEELANILDYLTGLKAEAPSALRQ